MPSELLDRLDLVLEPAERLRHHRAAEERHDVQLQVFEQLRVQLVAAAVVHPAQHHPRVHAQRRAGAEQAERLGLAEPVARHAQRGIQHALVDAVDHVEDADHGAGGQHVDLDPPAGHLVQLLRQVQGLLVEHARGALERLQLEVDDLPGLDRGRRRWSSSRGCRGGRAARRPPPMSPLARPAAPLAAPRRRGGGRRALRFSGWAQAPSSAAYVPNEKNFRKVRRLGSPMGKSPSPLVL